MSEMQATWRRPTSAARQGAQASPPPRPALETPDPRHSRLSGPQPRQPPGRAAAGEALGNLQAGGPAAAPGAGPSVRNGPAAQSGCPGPSNRPPTSRRHRSRCLLSSPRPSATGHARHPLGRRACSAGSRSEAACRSPGLRALSASPAGPGRPSFRSCGARREGQGLQAGTLGTSDTRPSAPQPRSAESHVRRTGAAPARVPAAPNAGRRLRAAASTPRPLQPLARTCTLSCLLFRPHVEMPRTF